MNIAIVDDSATDRRHLEQILQKYAAINQLEMNIEHFSGGEAFLNHYQPYQYTIIFLDIFMNGITGIKTAEIIRETDEESVLVFLTTSEDHRPEAFSVFATTYISKPSSREAIFRALDHILHCRTEKEQYFSFSYDRREYSLSYADIEAIETDRNYIVITDKRGASYRTRMTFSSVQEQMDARFLVLMKGIMVNMDYISQIQDTVCILRDGKTLPVQVKKKKEIQQKWLNYKFAAIRNATSRWGVKP